MRSLQFAPSLRRGACHSYRMGSGDATPDADAATVTVPTRATVLPPVVTARVVY